MYSIANRRAGERQQVKAGAVRDFQWQVQLLQLRLQFALFASTLPAFEIKFPITLPGENGQENSNEALATPRDGQHLGAGIRPFEFT